MRQAINHICVQSGKRPLPLDGELGQKAVDLMPACLQCQEETMTHSRSLMYTEMVAEHKLTSFGDSFWLF